MPALLNLFILWVILCTQNSDFFVPPCNSRQHQQPIANTKKCGFDTLSQSMPAIVPVAAVRSGIVPPQNRRVVPISRCNSAHCALIAKVKQSPKAQPIPAPHLSAPILPVIQKAIAQDALRSREPDQAAVQKPGTAIQLPATDGAENIKNLGLAARPPMVAEEKGNPLLNEAMTAQRQINVMCEKEEAIALCGGMEMLQEGVLDSHEEDTCVDAKENGLKQYKKWWFRRNVDISVNGDMITGTPVFIKENTLRVIGNLHSYFIPLHKVDYIRTDDGLENMCENEEEII